MKKICPLCKAPMHRIYPGVKVCFKCDLLDRMPVFIKAQQAHPSHKPKSETS